MKRIVLGAMALALVAAVESRPAAAAGELVLGLTMIQSGPLKSPGAGTEASVDIAVAEINAAGGVNGKMLKIIKFDTGSDPKQAAVATRKFAEDDGALAIIGPLSSGEAAVAFGAGERLGIVQIPYASSAPGLTKGKSYAYRLTEDEAKQFIRLLKSMKRKNVAFGKVEIFFVSDERISKIVGTKLMPALLGKFGAQAGEPIGFTYASFDLSAQASKAIQGNPDIMAVAGVATPAAKILKEMRRQGFKGRMIGSQLFAEPNNIELFGDLADGTLFASGFWWDQNDATRAFTAKYNEQMVQRGINRVNPHHVDAQAYDVVYLLAKVLAAANVTGDADKLAAERTAIRDTLKGITFSGITGTDICFDANGDAELPGFIIEMKGGQWNKFDEWPADKCE